MNRCWIIGLWCAGALSTAGAADLNEVYQRALAMEIVDGEMEILAAGDWKNFPDGSQNYPVHANAMASLPPGHFQMTKTGSHLRLEWSPDGKHGVGAVVRETTVK